MQGESITSSDPELGDPGESSELALSQSRRGQCWAGPPSTGWGQSWLSTQAPAPRLAPLHYSVSPSKCGLSFLKVIFTSGGSFSFLLLGTFLFYLKIATLLIGSEKSKDPFKPQIKTIQVQPQTFRKTCPYPTKCKCCCGPEWRWKKEKPRKI